MAARKARMQVEENVTAELLQSEAVIEAQQHVAYAAELLRSAGGEYEKLAWMLEEALVHFDCEARVDEAMLAQLMSAS